jgi:hypothetical protein
MRRRLISAAMVAAGLLMLPAPAAAGGGCPAGPWSEWTVAATAARIYPALIGFPGTLEEFTEVVRGDDRNGNGDLCMFIVWGTELNPNSHWYGVEGFHVIDDSTAR